MNLSFSRAQILAFLSPAIAVGSAALAAWLFVHVHFLGIFHTSQSQVGTLIASGVTFAVTAVIVWVSHHQHFIPITVARLQGVAQAGKLTSTQIIAFVTPYISVLAGALGAWLFVHLHLLGVLHLPQSSITQTIASALVFAVTAGVTWAAHNLHWLPITMGLTPQHPALRQR